jgi:VanZ family protein
MAIIFVQSSLPAIELPPVDIISTDKLIHMGVFGLLAALCYISLVHIPKKNMLNKSPFQWSAIIVTFYGATDEIHQYFVPFRSAEVLDWLADAAGVILVLILIKYYLQNKYLIFKRVEK